MNITEAILAIIIIAMAAFNISMLSSRVEDNSMVAQVINKETQLAKDECNTLQDTTVSPGTEYIDGYRVVSSETGDVIDVKVYSNYGEVTEYYGFLIDK
jgi:hypothetical protein